MLFNSFIFLVFFLIVVPVYYLLPVRWRNAWLLLASYVFYGYWDWRFCSLLAFTTALDYYVARWLGATDDLKKRKWIISISVVANLTLLGFFKYFNFFADSFDVMLSQFGMHLDYAHLNIILPVGISFYTFQSMSYTIDVYRRHTPAADSLLDFALFVSFFPQLVAGPVERASRLLPQLQSHKRATIDQFREGFILITMGMFKKVMIGDTCGRFVDHIFAEPQFYTSPELLMGAILFPIQIYADFSGYSSIARGTAKFFGVELMENFNQPYLAPNFTDFWRRWNISLSTWLRDYLYVSLGGNRKGVARTYVNIFLTMLLGGLWHGANWTYVAWGALHGTYLAVHRFISRGKKVADRFVYEGVGPTILFGAKVVSTFLLGTLASLVFRAPSFGDFFGILRDIFVWESSEFSGRIAVIIFTYVFVTILIDVMEYTTRDHAFLSRLRPVPLRYGFAVGIWAVTLLYLFQAPPMPFIYFQF